MDMPLSGKLVIVNSIRDKYGKVKKLVTQGATEGERIAAREAMLRMEQKHPELKNPERIQNQWGESFLKGFQPYVVYEEVKKTYTATWFSQDFSTNANFQIWYQDSYGTWRQVK